MILSISFISVFFNHLIICRTPSSCWCDKWPRCLRALWGNLGCNATGKPEPNISWTRVWENGTDSGALQSKDGYLVMADISRSSNGTYRCTAFNEVGGPVNQTVKVIVRCKLPRLCNVSFKLIKLSISLQYQTFFSLPIRTCSPSNFVPGSTFNLLG